MENAKIEKFKHDILKFNAKTLDQCKQLLFLYFLSIVINVAFYEDTTVVGVDTGLA